MPTLHLQRTPLSSPALPTLKQTNLLDLSLYGNRNTRQLDDGGGEIGVFGARIIYTAVSLLCMLPLAIMFGKSRRNLVGSSRTATNTQWDLVCIHFGIARAFADITFIRTLVYMLYGLAIAFVLAAAALESGMDLHTLRSCRAAIYICLIFYVGGKVCIQISLSSGPTLFATS